MGVYIPPKPGRQRSVSDALLEAEEEHYLDCPNADFLTRCAAFILDGIFLFLLATGLKKILGAIVFPPLVGPAEHLSYDMLLMLSSIQVAVQVMLFYFAMIWCQSTYGGSPAKLILGMRVIHAEDGKCLSLPQTILREVVGTYLLGALSLGAGWCLPLFRKDRRSLADLISGSEVKKVRGNP